MSLNFKTVVKHRPEGIDDVFGDVQQAGFANSFQDPNAVNASTVRRYRVSGATSSIDPFEGDYSAVRAVAIKLLGKYDPFEGLFVGPTSTEFMFALHKGSDVVFRPSGSTNDVLWVKSMSGATVYFQVISWGLTASSEGSG